MTVTAVRLGGRRDQPLLVLGPTLGTSARTLWADAAEHLARDFQVVGWDLPGHGTNAWLPEPEAEPLTVRDLARGLLAIVDELADSFEPARFHYAGGSVGAAVGLRLLLDAPQRVVSATLLGSGAGSADPAPASRLPDGLVDTDDRGYAVVRAALASSDVGDRWDRVTRPDRRLVVLDDVGNLAPAEDPVRVARLIRSHALGEPDPVPESVSGSGDAPGRTGLSGRDRSLVTLAAGVAAGHPEELTSHVRTARAHGVTAEEIREVVRLSAGGEGPDMDAARRVADRALAELGDS